MRKRKVIEVLEVSEDVGAREDEGDGEILDRPLPFGKPLLQWDIIDWKRILSLDTLTQPYLNELFSDVDTCYDLDPDDRTWVKDRIREKLRLGQYFSDAT